MTEREKSSALSMARVEWLQKQAAPTHTQGDKRDVERSYLVARFVVLESGTRRARREKPAESMYTLPTQKKAEKIYNTNKNKQLPKTKTKNDSADKKKRRNDEIRKRDEKHKVNTCDPR